MGDQAAGIRSRLQRPLAVPRIYLGLGVVYVLVRILAIAGTAAVGAFPDSATYRQGAGEPVYRFVSLTGHAMRPWVPPLLFANLPSDSARAGAQVLISIGAWLVLATTVALALRDRRVRMAAFVVILALSCTTAVTSWDRIIGAESTSISFAVLALAAWIRFAKKPTGLNSVAVVLAMIFWSFTKSGMFPVVGLAAAIVLFTMINRRDRALRGAVAVALMLVALWGLAANSRSDTAYEAYNDQGLSQFSGNFATLLRLQILTDRSDTAWFVHHGMPDPKGLLAYKRPTVLDDTWTTGEQPFLSAYLARRDLTHWVNTRGRSVYSQFIVTHPGEIGSRFVRDLRYMVVPTRRFLIYDRAPREVMPAVVRNLLFDTSSGPGLPRAIYGDVGLLVVACLVLVFVPRRRARDARLLLVAGATFLLSMAAIMLGWLFSPIEIVRHAIPATIVLRLALWLTVFALLDAILNGQERKEPASIE